MTNPQIKSFQPLDMELVSVPCCLDQPAFKGDNQIFTRALKQKHHFPTEVEIPHDFHWIFPKIFFPDQAFKIPIIGKIPHF